MANPEFNLISRVRDKVVERLRARGLLAYPTQSESLVVFRRAMAWLREHTIENEGVAADNAKLAVDVRASSELVDCLKHWGERAEAAQLAAWISGRDAEQSGGLPVVAVEPGDESLRAAVVANQRGDAEAVVRLLQAVATKRLKSGGLPGGAGGRRCCPMSTATAAALWFEAGNWTEGEPLFQALLKHLTRGGGFGAVIENRDPRAEYAACVAAYLKALHFRLRTGFERTASLFPETIPAEDGRFALVEKVLAESGARSVIDAGCGKGRFIKLLKLRHPEIDARAVDISAPMLKLLPSDIQVQVGSLLDMGLPDGAGDFVFCIEALEHAVNARSALRELARVTAPHGQLLIIDKCASSLGSMEICDWEQWFNADDVTAWLVAEGFAVEVQRGVYKPGMAELDRRFLCWIARRALTKNPS